jgi:hypothetical protein
VIWWTSGRFSRTRANRSEIVLFFIGILQS